MHGYKYVEARGTRDVVMDPAEYISLIRRGMAENAEVFNLPADAFERADRIARAKSHLLTMLEDPDLVANSSQEELDAWRLLAGEP
jgi:hypothetical protein